MSWSFANFELDPERFELRNAGALVALEPQVFELLSLLIGNRHRLVTKEEIIESVWGGRCISDSSLSSRIKSARKAVGDDGATQHTIRTIHGKGFRFVAETSLRQIAAVVRQDQPDLAHAPDADTGRRPTIVVLPFRSLGTPDVGEVLAEAIPHELIQALCKLRWLMVIARGTAFKFRSENEDLTDIASALKVRYVLVGSVEILGPRLVISVELSDSRSGEVIWGDRYSLSRDGLHEVRAEIAASVVAALEIYIPLNEARDARIGTSENLDAWANYHLGLQQVYRFSQEGNERATGLFQKAVVQDPGFARAHAGLSFTSFQDAFVNYSGDPVAAAKAAARFAERSIELDPLDPFSNLVMGRSFWLRNELELGLDWLDRSIVLSPNYAHGHYSHAFADMLSSREHNARAHVDTACQLSPLDPMVYAMHSTRALSFIVEGDYESAAKWAEAGARSPNSHFLIGMIAVLAHCLNRDPEKAQFWKRNVAGRRPYANQEHFFKSFPFTDPEVRHRIASALTLSGY